MPPRAAETRTPGRGPERQGTDAVAWRELADEAARCRRCPLCRERTHVVFYRGAARPSVVFVGEAPGRAEDLAGVPFVGRAGRRLDAAIAQVGLAPSEFGIVNLLKCRPPSNRFDAAAARTCRSFLDRQLELLDPARIVTLGAHALRTLAPDAPSVTEAAGRPRALPGRSLFPLLHPAAAMHAPRYRARWEADLIALERWLRDGAAETL